MVERSRQRESWTANAELILKMGGKKPQIVPTQMEKVNSNDFFFFGDYGERGIK